MVRPTLGIVIRLFVLGRRDPSGPGSAGHPDDPDDPSGAADPNGPGDRKPGPGRRMPFARLAVLAERAERAPSLDAPVQVLSDVVVRALPPGTRLDDALHGVPFGQPAHPAVVRLPLGCWTSAVLLDFLPGLGFLPGGEHLSVTEHFPEAQRSHASQALLAIGLAAALPSAATGLADWSALHRHQQRVGIIHAIAQGSASVLFAASLLARLGGQRTCGKALGLAGLTAATAGAYLGGHLALRLGAGASHAEPIDHLAALGWQDLCPLDELPDGHPARRQLGYLSLLAIRQGDAVHVLSDHCAHLGGPLHQGSLTQVRGQTCISCPWHGSVFQVSDGAVVHGPATARQPSFDSRVTDSGLVQVRPRSPRPPARPREQGPREQYQ
jgi:nitrite reductase/ring-hydroxylating ferredoxin subunit/uncharacterized membrane protein